MPAPRSLDVHRVGVLRDGTPAPVIRHGWWLDGLLLTAFAGLTAALVWWSQPLTLDLAARNWVDAHRPPPIRDLLWVADHVGQGGLLITVTLMVGVWLVWRRRTVRPLLPAVAAPILVIAVIEPLKRWTERGAPHDGSVHLFSAAGSVEYPSGHVANAIVYYGVLVLLLAPYLSAGFRVLVRWLPGVLVVVGTTGLGYHWLSDSIAGYLVGLLMVRALLRVPWATLPLPAALGRRTG